MTDGVIKGTGNSRYLKTVSNAPTTYPTYESFIQALAAGTLPIDLNGINSTGWTTQGTKLNKANLLTDATAKLAGLTSSATPNTMFAKLANLAAALDTGKCSVEVGSYTGTDVNTKTLTFSGKPQMVEISPNNGYSSGTVRPMIRGSSVVRTEGGSVSPADEASLTWGENSVTLTSTTNSAYEALNSKNYSYFYAAICT